MTRAQARAVRAEILEDLDGQIDSGCDGLAESKHICSGCYADPILDRKEADRVRKALKRTIRAAIAALTTK